MKTSDKGLALIKQFEGFSPVPYRCPAGLWTIGYGHVMHADARNQITAVTEREATDILQQDVRIAEQSVARMIAVPLTQAQFDALVSFTFNLGAAALQRSTLRRVVNRGAHGDVPCQFLCWVWAAGRKLPGLVRRRAAEAEMYQVIDY